MTPADPRDTHMHVKDHRYRTCYEIAQDRKVLIDPCMLTKSHSLALYSYKMIQLATSRPIIPQKVAGIQESV